MDESEHPLVSVVVPVHNGGHDLQICLEALQAVEYTAWECIVVDDGSTDGSVEMARRYGARVINSLQPHTGPAEARNLGALAARGSILLFIDADVQVRPETIGRVVNILHADPDLAACFGSYDDEPADPGLLSQYKNLKHHYVHQTSNQEASTFWTGCGAIRRSVFLHMGGFSTSYARPSIEDINLGYRLRAAGYRIRLDKELQVRHLKRWTPKALLLTDLRDRAIPWTKLILQGNTILDDLNIKTTQRLSVIAAYTGLLAALVSPLVPWALVLVALAPGALFALNWDFYRFLVDRRGIWFLLRALPWHWIYFLYSGLGFGLGVLSFAIDRLQGQVQPARHLGDAPSPSDVRPADTDPE